MADSVAEEALANYHRDLANLEALVVELKKTKDQRRIAALVQRGNTLLTLISINAHWLQENAES